MNELDVQLVKMGSIPKKPSRVMDCGKFRIALILVKASKIKPQVLYRAIQSAI